MQPASRRLVVNRRPPVVFVRRRRVRACVIPDRRARVTRATRENTPKATHNHSISPSPRPRQPVIRCLSRHLVGLDFLSFEF